jgi:hypothetical protein
LGSLGIENQKPIFIFYFLSFQAGNNYQKIKIKNKLYFYFIFERPRPQGKGEGSS